MSEEPSPSRGTRLRSHIPRATRMRVGRKHPYVYEIKLALRSSTWDIYRRYSEFHALFKQIRDQLVPHPPFPPKKIVQNTDPKFIEQRRKQLETYLDALLGLDDVLLNPHVRSFLHVPSDALHRPSKPKSVPRAPSDLMWVDIQSAPSPDYAPPIEDSVVTRGVHGSLYAGLDASISKSSSSVRSEFSDDLGEDEEAEEEQEDKENDINGPKISSTAKNLGSQNRSMLSSKHKPSSGGSSSGFWAMFFSSEQESDKRTSASSSGSDPPLRDPTKEEPLRFVAISSFRGEQGDLCFDKGASISVTGVDEKTGWWVGTLDGHNYGLVPMNFVKVQAGREKNNVKPTMNNVTDVTQTDEEL
eukprot:m.138886 g.138886  ORF g.138886 m.138886 type:complete len:358 (+) comp24052_c0_seq2:438-1511(+)